MDGRAPLQVRRVRRDERADRRDRGAATPPPSLRLGTAADVDACARVWALAILDYERRLRPGAIAGDLGPVTRLLEHLRTTDPECFWVATRPVPAAGADDRPTSGDELVVGFAAASLRDSLWFLALLFVMPDEQAHGLGRTLLARCRPEPGARGSATHATVTDAAQPISNALYARAGMVPRLPAYRVVGRPKGGAPALPGGVRMERLGDDPAAAADLETVDRAVLGRGREPDHGYFRRDGRIGFLFRDPDGRPVAYGYASPVGRVGPVAVLEPELLVPVVFRLLAAVEPRGASALTVTGATPELLVALLEAGMRLDGFPALLCWDRPFADLERYCLASYALP